MFVRKGSDLWEDILAVVELRVFWKLLQTFSWVCEWGGRDGRQTPSFHPACIAASANLPCCLSYTDALIFFFFEGFRFLMRWLSSQEHVLCLLRTWVWFPASTPCRSPQPVTLAPENLIPLLTPWTEKPTTPQSQDMCKYTYYKIKINHKMGHFNYIRKGPEKVKFKYPSFMYPAFFLNSTQ